MPEEELGKTQVPTAVPMSDKGLRELLKGLQYANAGDTEGAGAWAWELSEADVQAGLAILSIMQQALLAQGTNFQFGRLLADSQSRERLANPMYVFDPEIGALSLAAPQGTIEPHVPTIPTSDKPAVVLGTEERRARREALAVRQARELEALETSQKAERGDTEAEMILAKHNKAIQARDANTSWP